MIIYNKIKNKRQLQCLLSATVSKIGVVGLFFVESSVKVDGKYSQDVLLSQEMLYPLGPIRYVASDNFVFQQDSAPAHRAPDTIELLQRETAGFVSPELWSPNRPDLNPADYKIWGIMQQHVYEMQIHNVDELKRRLVDVCSGLQQSVVGAAVSEWRKRLHACVRTKGGHFEHLL